MKSEILILDDNPELNEVFKELLGIEGYKVQVFSQLEPCLEALDSGQHFDYAFVDCNINRKPTFLFMESIVRRKLIKSVFAMSGFLEEEWERSSLKHGASRFFLKPFDIISILQEVSKQEVSKQEKV